MSRLGRLFFGFGLVALAAGATDGVAITMQSPPVSADTVSEITKGVKDSGAKADDNTAGLLKTIQTVVNIILFLVGAAAVIIIVIAGFRLVTANGDSGTISTARNTVLYALIGLVVAFLAFALVKFVTQQLAK